MAFASDAADRNAHAPTAGDDHQGTGFSFTLAKTSTAFFGGFEGQFEGRLPRTDAASHADPGRGREPHRGAPRAPADR